MQKKTNILCIHYNGNSSGSFVDKSIRQLKDLSDEFEFTFLIPEDGCFTEALRFAGGNVLTWPIHEFDKKIHRTLFHAFKFSKLLINKKIDLVYVMDFVNWKPVELMVAKWLGVPTLVFCDYYKPEVFKDSFLKHCSKIITNSNATALRIANNCFADKTQVIYNSIDTSKYSLNKETREKNLTLGFIGSLIPIKGIEFLLEALPEILKLSPIERLKIAGTDRDNIGYDELLQQLASSLNIKDQVEFLGHVDPANFFSDIDILVVPSIDEPFGYINIEAAASGIPVIGTRVGGIPEIILDNETGLLIPPNDKESISQACISLASNLPLRKKMGRLAKRRADEFFSLNTNMPKWRQVFRETMR